MAAPGANDSAREDVPSHPTAVDDSAPGCDDGPNEDDSDGSLVAIKGNHSHRHKKSTRRIIDDSDESEDEEATAPVSTAITPPQQQSTTTPASQQSDTTHDTTGDHLSSQSTSDVDSRMLESQPASEQPSTSSIMYKSTTTTTHTPTIAENPPSSSACHEPGTPPPDTQSPTPTTHERVEEEQRTSAVRVAVEAAPHTSTARGSLEVTDAQRREFNRLVLKAHDLLENGKLAAALDVYTLAQRIVCTEKISRRIAKIKAQLDADNENDDEDASASHHDGNSEDDAPSSDDGESQADGWTIHQRTQMATLGADFRIPLEAYANLYPHQREGVKWLAGFAGNKVGGILGDDMGMGKTVQVATFLRGALAKRQGIKTVSCFSHNAVYNTHLRTTTRTTLSHNTVDGIDYSALRLLRTLSHSCIPSGTACDAGLSDGELAEGAEEVGS